MKAFGMAVAVALSGCASTTVYQPVTTKGKDGATHAKAVKVFAVQGDISGAFTLTTQPGGGVTLEVKPLDAGQVLMQRIAVTDGKGNPLRDKAGNAVYNEIPLVAGLNHSRPTSTAWDGISQGIRSIGSVVGTAAAAIMGAQAATSLAGAIPPTTP